MSGEVSCVLFEVVPAEEEISGEPELYANRTDGLIERLRALDPGAVSSSIRQLVEQLAEAFSPRPDGPAECEIEFALKVAAEGGIIVSKLSGDVSMRVKVVWKRT